MNRKNIYLIFMNSILDIYRHENGLFGFTCYRGSEYLQVFNGQPLYNSKRQALREAKKYYIVSSVVRDTKTVKVVFDLSTNIVFGESKLAKKIFNSIEKYEVAELSVEIIKLDNQTKLVVKTFVCTTFN